MHTGVAQTVVDVLTFSAIFAGLVPARAGRTHGAGLARRTMGYHIAAQLAHELGAGHSTPSSVARVFGSELAIGGNVSSCACNSTRS